MLDQRRRRCADIVSMLYKCFVFAGQEDFLSNIVHLSNVGLMLGQRCIRWPNIKTALKFILTEFMSYLGERGVLCVGNG